MNKEQARNLVRQTLTKSFDKARFRNFVLELLNEFDELKALPPMDYSKTRSHVGALCERLGTYTSPEEEKLDVLVVHLTDQSKLERARTALRNFVADHLKREMEKMPRSLRLFRRPKTSGVSLTSRWNTPRSRKTQASWRGDPTHPGSPILLYRWRRRKLSYRANAVP